MSTKVVKNSLAAKEAKIETKLLENLENVLQALFPNGSHSGSEFLIGDVLGTAGKSLKICLKGDKRGLWQDFATGEGGTPLQLIALHYELDLTVQRSVVLERAEKLLEAVAKLPAKDVLPGPKKISQALQEVFQWDYLTADGAYLWTVKRFVDAAGKKSIRPFNKRTGIYAAPPKRRPLYNLPGIAQAAVVIIVEGEKCAQALIDAGHCATTAMMGATAPSRCTDWSPLQGKDVLIWPDHDEAGKKYAINCTEAALEAGACSCAVLVIPEEQPKGWDAADAIAGSTFDVEGFLKDGERQSLLLPNTVELMAAFADGDATSEDGIARVLTERYAVNWKYCAAWGRWYFWDAKRWVPDQVLAFSHLAREVCRAASTLARQGSRARIASAATVANVERLTRADPAHATAVEQWDADPLLLNTPGGMVDLRTGQLSPPEPSAYLTKSTTATPEGDCPQWLDFLKMIAGGDQELIDYLQRVVGYCLTGQTTEHALFFLYGTGANGKSVFLNVISTILGDYAKSAPMDTFMNTRSEQHPTDLAGLRGARFVCATETEQGRLWNESKIKAITGGDTISARFMRQNFFQYKPQFKVLIAGNHRPAIANVDEAMSRRIHLIPFAITIPPEQRDKHLTEKLLKEAGGILAWAIEGLQEWRKKNGLHPPKAVTEATQEYLHAEDSVGRWMEECCETNSSAFSSSQEAFQSWKRWAEDQGEFVGTQRNLSNQLVAKSFLRGIQGDDRGFKGFSVKKTPDTGGDTQSTPTESTGQDLADQL